VLRQLDIAFAWDGPCPERDFIPTGRRYIRTADKLHRDCNAGQDTALPKADDFIGEPMQVRKRARGVLSFHSTGLIVGTSSPPRFNVDRHGWQPAKNRLRILPRPAQKRVPVRTTQKLIKNGHPQIPEFQRFQRLHGCPSCTQKNGQTEVQASIFQLTIHDCPFGTRTAFV